MNRTNQRACMFLMATIVCPLFAAPSGAEPTKSIETLAAEFADTPTQHQALAVYYREKATEARREAKRLRMRAVSFVGHTPGTDVAVSSLNRLRATKAERRADRLDSIAVFHESEAQNAVK